MVKGPFGTLGLGNEDDKTTPAEITDAKIKGKIKNIFMSNDGGSTFIPNNRWKTFFFW